MTNTPPERRGFYLASNRFLLPNWMIHSSVEKSSLTGVGMIAYDWQVIGMLMVSFNKVHVIGREREKDCRQLHHHGPGFFEHCVDAQKQRYMIFRGYSDRSLEWGRGQWIATGDYVFMAWFGNKIIDPFSGISPGILSWGESKASNQSSRLRIWNSKGCAD